MPDRANDRKNWAHAVDPPVANGAPQTGREISPIFQDPEIAAAVLANHGTIGVATTLMKAQYWAEIIEETAHIAYVRDTLMAAHGKSVADLPQFGTNANEKAALGA